jgi:hypothetical protein
MQSATVIQAGYVEHPESGDELLRIAVDAPWASGGTSYPSTDIWCDRSAPPPLFGDAVQWDERQVILHGVTYRKPEYDSSPAAPLH